MEGDRSPTKVGDHKPYICKSPRRFATAMASVRLSTFSFRKSDWTWLFTVPSEIARLAPMSLFVFPAATSCNTFDSRGVSSSEGSRSISFAATVGGDTDLEKHHPISFALS